MSDGAERAQRALERGCSASCARLRDPAGRLPLGSRAGLRQHRAVHHRRSLRSGRRHRARRAAASSNPSSATCCSRWCSTRRWARSAAGSISRASPTPSPTSSPRAIRMCSRTRESARRPSRTAPGKNTRRANARRAAARSPSELADVPLALPALARAAKLGKRAGRVGLRLARRAGRAREDRRRVARGGAGRRPRSAPRSSATCCSPWRTGRGISRVDPGRSAAARQREIRDGASAPWKTLARAAFAGARDARRRGVGCAVERGEKARKDQRIQRSVGIHRRLRTLAPRSTLRIGRPMEALCRSAARRFW